MGWSVLIVGDHAGFPGFPGFARRLLEADGSTVVAEAADGTSALAALEDQRPDLAWLDIMLPGIDGFTGAERLAELPAPPLVVLTSSRDALDYARRLQETPAIGFLHKDDLSGTALAALAGGA
jgi:CheY-like chemotaxis protein